MHVLVISSGYPNDYEPLDGIFYRDQAEALAASGHEVGVITTIPVSIFSFLKRKKWLFGYKVFQKNGVETMTYTYLNRPKSPVYGVLKAKKHGLRMFNDYLKKHGRPDLIHLHCFEAGELAQKISSQWGIPYVVTEHSSRFLLNTIPVKLEKYAQATFSGAKERIAVSHFLSETLSKKYQVSFTYVPNIVDTDSFDLRRNVKKCTDFTFIHVAGLNANKNQTMLLEAFKQFNNNNPNTSLNIVGDGPMRQELQQITNKLLLSEKVHFMGYQSRDELSETYNKCHAFILSSHRETFGVVLIEAMSCGLPVLSTRCGGPESIITDASLGELTDISSDELSQGMERVYAKRLLYDSEAIRTFVVNNFSGPAVAKKLSDIYQIVLRDYDEQK